MLRIYEAKTEIGLSVLRGGKNVHVSFRPKTGGGSVFSTDDDELAKGLESHWRYGKLFKKVSEKEEAPRRVAKITKPVTEAPKQREMTFSDYEDAKDWLVEQFGLSRTKLRSTAAIEAAAAQNNIKLVIDK